MRSIILSILFSVIIVLFSPVLAQESEETQKQEEQKTEEEQQILPAECPHHEHKFEHKEIHSKETCPKEGIIDECEDKCPGSKEGEPCSCCKKMAGGFGFFSFGPGILNLGDLNSELKSNNYPEFSENLFGMGGGGFAIVNKVVIGGEGYALTAKDVSNNNYKLSLSANYGFFDLGYVIFKKGNLFVYPMVGFGGGGIELKIRKPGEPTFNDIMQDPKWGSTISTGGFLLNFSIGSHFLFAFGKDEKGTGGIAIGFRAGYVYTPFEGDWVMDTEKVGGGPQIGVTGPYVYFSVGGGGFGWE